MELRRSEWGQVQIADARFQLQPQGGFGVYVASSAQKNGVSAVGLADAEEVKLARLDETTGAYCSCWMPASSQPPLPLRGLTRCQTSSKDSTGPFFSSRIWPVKRTLTT